VVGLAVGTPFAVLVAEQLRASGVQLSISITAAGQIRPLGHLPYSVLITQALRDEYTSLHCLSPGRWSRLCEQLERGFAMAFESCPSLFRSAHRGPPTRRFARLALQRTPPSRRHRRREMEAAALYAEAYAKARGGDVVCFAHITDAVATTTFDFEKGAANDAVAALELAAPGARAMCHVPVGRGRPGPSLVRRSHRSPDRPSWVVTS